MKRPGAPDLPWFKEEGPDAGPNHPTRVKPARWDGCLSTGFESPRSNESSPVLQGLR